jgi:hypothetical protein
MWPVWRLVTAKVATLQEIRSSWYLEDIRDGNEALDALAEAEAELAERSKRK